MSDENSKQEAVTPGDDLVETPPKKADGGVPVEDYDIAAAGTALAIGADCLDRMATAFETSAKRWELIVYPSVFAFVILASYGFYLIYSLTTDVSYLTQSVDRNMTAMSQDIHTMTGNIGVMSDDIRSMAVNLQSVSNNVGQITVSMETLQSLEPMLTHMGSLNNSIHAMSVNTHLIRGDMSNLNHSIGRPMGMMNSMMPW